MPQKIYSTISYPEKTENHQYYLEQANTFSPDVIILFGGSELKYFAYSANKAGLSSQLLSIKNLYMKELIDSSKASNNLIFQTQDYNSSHIIYNFYSNQDNFSPLSLTAQARDALFFIDTARRQEKLKSEDFLNFIASKQWNGALGNTSFNVSGQINAKTVFFKIFNGMLTKVE